MPLSDEEDINLRVTAVNLAASTHAVFQRTPEQMYEFLTDGLPDMPILSIIPKSDAYATTVPTPGVDDDPPTA